MTFVKLGLLATLFTGVIWASEPCCGVTAINTRTGLVSAREIATGRTFQFSASAAVIAKLQVGQRIYANFGAKQVSVDGAQPCCGIVDGPAATAPANPGVPCCSVVSVDASGGIATARDNATGRTFNFKVADAVLLKSLPGRSVFANFQTNQVSVDGGAPCCGIVATVATSAEPPQAGPCCGITSIDGKTSIVTAKDTASGRVFQFPVSAALLRTIHVGQPVYANYTTKEIAIIAGQPCCAMSAPLDLKRGVR